MERVPTISYVLLLGAVLAFCFMPLSTGVPTTQIHLIKNMYDVFVSTELIVPMLIGLLPLAFLAASICFLIEYIRSRETIYIVIMRRLISVTVFLLCSQGLLLVYMNMPGVPIGMFITPALLFIFNVIIWIVEDDASVFVTFKERIARGIIIVVILIFALPYAGFGPFVIGMRVPKSETEYIQISKKLEKYGLYSAFSEIDTSTNEERLPPVPQSSTSRRTLWGLIYLVGLLGVMHCLREVDVKLL